MIHVCSFYYYCKIVRQVHKIFSFYRCANWDSTRLHCSENFTCKSSTLKITEKEFFSFMYVRRVGELASASSGSRRSWGNSTIFLIFGLFFAPFPVPVAAFISMLAFFFQVPPTNQGPGYWQAWGPYLSFVEIQWERESPAPSCSAPTLEISQKDPGWHGLCYMLFLG